MPAMAIAHGIIGAALAYGRGARSGPWAETLRFKADLLPVPSGSKASGSVVADYRLPTARSSPGAARTRASARTPHRRASTGRRAGPAAASFASRPIDSPFQGSAILSHTQGEGPVGGEWSIVIRTAGFPKVSCSASWCAGINSVGIARLLEILCARNLALRRRTLADRPQSAGENHHDHRHYRNSTSTVLPHRGRCPSAASNVPWSSMVPRCTHCNCRVSGTWRALGRRHDLLQHPCAEQSRAPRQAA